MYKFDVHIHSVASGHAYSTITENARYASKKGLKFIAITDHAPNMPGGACELHFLNLHVLPKYIEGIRVLKGVELNIMDGNGTIDLPERILKKMDVVIASLHKVCIPPGESTQALIHAAENPYVQILGHPGDPRYPIDIKKVVTAAKETNTLIEINNSSLDPDNSRQGGEKVIVEIIKECKRQNHSIILGSDAHYHTYIGDFSRITPLLKEADMPDELIINTDPQKFLNMINKNLCGEN